uniref:Uncharacterized protein n=1 Tax=Alexandrium catenella TaxID=2925 RepID=A0A7S1R8L4_ALECA|eukprot:UN0681
MLTASMLGGASLGVSAELTVLFVSGSVAVVMASLLCVSINWQVPMYEGLAREAALKYPELGGVAKDVCSDFLAEHMELNPVQLMFMPATPALLSLLWSGLVVLAGIFFASLPSVCLPLFFSRGCS